VTSTCLEHPSVHSQEDLYMQFYGISCIHPCKQSGQWQDVLHTKLSNFLRKNTWMFETCRSHYN